MIFDSIVIFNKYNAHHYTVACYTSKFDKKVIICDWICKKGLICAIINTEKSRFEILIVYLKNAWCLVYKLLHQSIVIQGNSAGALFDGLLAELSAILDSFFTSTTSEYIRVVGGGGGEPRSGGKNTRCVVTPVLWIHRCLNWSKKWLNQ